MQTNIRLIFSLRRLTLILKGIKIKKILLNFKKSYFIVFNNFHALNTPF